VGIIFLLSLFAWSSLSMAVVPSEIIEMLRIADNKLSQGHLTYNMTKNIQFKDITDKRDVSVNLYYTNNGQYHVINSGNIGQYPAEILYDGKDIFAIEGKKENRPSIEVQVRDTSYPFHFTASSFSKELCNGPCFPLGRGLSLLKEIKILQDSSGIHLNGKTPEGVNIEAILDERYHYVAKEIILKSGQDGKILKKWIISNPKEFSNDIYIATEAKLINVSGRILTTYSINEAHFRLPDRQYFTFNFHNPDYTIVDGRVNGQVFVYKPNSLPSDVTSDSLLKMTEENIKRNIDIVKESEKYFEKEKKQKQKGLIARYVITSFIICIFGLLLFIRFRKRGITMPTSK